MVKEGEVVESVVVLVLVVVAEEGGVGEEVVEAGEEMDVLR